MLLPRYGFSSAAWDAPRQSIEVERVGSVERATITFAGKKSGAIKIQPEYAGIPGLSAQYSEEGELLVYNNGAVWREEDGSAPAVSPGYGFAICLKCGYADSESHQGQGRIDLPAGFAQHARLTSTKKYPACWQEAEAPVLRNQTLAARQTTDVLMLAFSDSLLHLAKDEALTWTIAHGLQIAGAKLLELDTRELGVMVTNTADGYGAILYDNTPGGAGHVRELLDFGRSWIEEACRVLYLNKAHDQRCKTACLDCLLTFDAQEAMHAGLLKRRMTLVTLTSLLAGNRDASMTEGNYPLDSSPPASDRNTKERIARAQMRTAHRTNKRK